MGRRKGSVTVNLARYQSGLDPHGEARKLVTPRAVHPFSSLLRVGIHRCLSPTPKYLLGCLPTYLPTSILPTYTYHYYSLRLDLPALP